LPAMRRSLARRSAVSSSTASRPRSERCAMYSSLSSSRRSSESLALGGTWVVEAGGGKVEAG
jgi:hypothetical protein